jgi:hypothetical protein
VLTADSTPDLPGIRAAEGRAETMDVNADHPVQTIKDLTGDIECGFASGCQPSCPEQT